MESSGLGRLYDPVLFEQVGKALIEETRRHLERSTKRPYPSLQPTPPGELVKRAGEWLDRRPAQTPEALTLHARELARLFLDHTNPLHSPHYMGHQVPPPVPIPAAFAAIGAVSNPGAAVFEMGPTSIAAEKALSERMGRYLGWEAGFDSIVTHGGSLANLTAILAARNLKFPGFWQKGAQARRPALFTSQDAHYSIARAAGIIGLGSDAVFKVGLDSKRRMDPTLLTRACDQAVAQGYEPFCVVSSSCSTPIGAFDPLEPIAEFTKKRGLWLHADAAHGGGLLLSRKHRKLMTGIEHADSVTWDAHKMMFVPALSTFLFYREAKHSYAPFEQDAPYLFDPDAPDVDDAMAYDPGLRTVECTKGPLSLVPWALWSCFGPEAIEALVDRVIELTRELHGLLSESEDFIPLHEPECNILCFRYLPARMKSASPEEISRLQLELRQKLLKTGRYYITGTRLDGVYALRVTLMTPSITRAELESLLGELRSLAAGA